ncbi:unnamed protein product [Strongylus vulgaris]|uniref:Fungal lipase-type domain-containing protein n=1 Tax=Strongylus vulgaris TaxID=40348 RepID=A0A3P7J717_STRVU|nr:unnamed protein product [Strongylus vulgaris]
MITLVFLSGIIATYAQWGYTDDFARNKIFPLSAAAYSENPKDCVGKVASEANTIRNVTVKCDDRNTCSGYTAVLPSQKAIVLSFRGTKTKLQLLEITRITLGLKRWRWYVGNKYLGQVGKYFYDAFHAIWSHGMHEHLRELLEKYPEYMIWITGHSLGGSLASLAASHIVASELADGNRIKLVTFGQPRTGDETFVNYLSKQVYYRNGMGPSPQDFTVCDGGRNYSLQICTPC